METTIASSTTEIIPEADSGIVAGEVLSSIVGLAFLVILVKCCKSSNSGDDWCRCICGCFAEICRIIGQCFVDVTNMACKIICSCKICENSEPENTTSRSHRRYTTEEIMRAAAELSAPAPVDLPPPSYDRVMEENDNGPCTKPQFNFPFWKC
ncbi:hypothetical protein FSP39_015493 [Pinctada imbricata]|uniref:Uncharacterized protein n=1 Tax=Pinctada imbricata TaxID=66713 RepID=A0AA89C4Z3_PINIB|nr:hypothetical protein FSP39_015493 [Pinctada imbricata]